MESELGIPLPLHPCTAGYGEGAAIYWLGPDEWLLAVAAVVQDDLAARLRSAYPGHCSVVDVGGGLTLVNLSGSEACTLLKKSCCYDFHPTNFAAGRCVQTTFAQATALVASRDADSYDLVIRRSFADYIARWLLDAGAEFASD